ncbi:MAG: TonB-dependent receptor [Caulobacterales bacterium]|nr:TonB-dependent receptor [Caulobacterales bacterium]MCA0371795.1 TonB-dependent receptor [Pseudomonadota bacterium]
MKKTLYYGTFLAGLLFTTSAFADDIIPQQKQQDNNDAEQVVVVGKGIRQTQTLKIDTLKLQSAGTSPIKLVERLPGVNFTGADAFGAYEWAVRISVRGFAQQQMGFTLDGVPLGDMSYGNFNGLHISRALISENLAEVKMSQGAGLLSTNSTSNLGGTLQFASKQAQEEKGLDTAISFGSDTLFRAYGRYDTGSIEGFGRLRLYASAMHNEVEKWKGDGKQIQNQANVGFVWPIADGEFTGLYSISKRREADYQDLSKEMINRLGYDWDNFAPDWQLAQRVADIAINRGDISAPITNAAAGTVYPGKILTVDDAYFDAAGLRNDELTRLGYKGNFNDNLSFDIALYNHNQKGQGLWFTPYVSPFSFGQGVAGVTSPVSVRTTEYDMSRLGSFASVEYRIGNHAIEGGYWVEDNDFNQARRFYANTRAMPNDVMKFQKNPFATQWELNYNINTQVYHLQDTWKLAENLKLQYGFKSIHVDTRAKTITNGFVTPVAGSDTDLKGTIVSKDNFLPQIGVTYDINRNYQLFAGYTENMRAFDLAPFSNLRQDAFNFIKTNVKPESSNTTEGGLRFRGQNFQGVIAAYYVKFDNRLLSIAQGSGIQGNPSIITNVGGVETKGFEAAGQYKFNKEFSLYTSYSYNDSQYQDDVYDSKRINILQNTKGKTVVNAPKHLLKANLNYDNGKYYANLGANYTSERESTYTNVGGRIDAFTTVDLGAGVRLDTGAQFGPVEIQLNITNLLDEEYISTIGTNGFSAAGDSQTYMVGAPRKFSLTLRKKFK